MLSKISLFPKNDGKKFISEDEKTKYLIKLQKEVEKHFLEVEQYRELGENDQVLFHQFHDAISLMRKSNFLIDKKLSTYMKNVDILLKDEEEEIPFRYLNIAIYTCMVVSSRNKIFEIKMETVRKLMASFVSVELSSTNYQTYLDIILDKNIIEIIENYKESYPIEHIISEVLCNEEVFSRDPEIMRYRFQKELLEDIRHFNQTYSEEEFRRFALGEDLTLDSVYQYLERNMNSLNQLPTEQPIYSEMDFICLKKMKHFIYLTKERKEEFLMLIKEMDAEQNIGLLKKITKMLILIEVYDEYVDKSSKIITPTFQTKKR